MPQFATADRTSLGFIEETTFGTTPTIGNTNRWQDLRFTGESLNYGATYETSQEIRADRMTPDTIQVGRMAEGGFEGELSYGTYDTLMEGAAYSDWETGGTDLDNDTTLSITVTGTPSVTKIVSTASGKFTAANGFIAGRNIRITGFANNGTLFASVLSINTNGTELTIDPITPIAAGSGTANATVELCDYLRNGTTLKSYSFIKRFNDLAVPEYQRFRGLRNSTWNLELAVNSILNTGFEFMGTDATMNETAPQASHISAQSSSAVLNAVDDIAIINLGAGTQQRFFNNLSLTIDNNLRAQDAIGHLGHVGLAPGRLSVTGQVELYFEDSSQFDAFGNDERFGISFLVVDGSDNNGNAYIFSLPANKYTGMEIVAGSLDSDVLVQADFESLINDAGTYQFQIGRIAAS